MIIYFFNFYTKYTMLSKGQYFSKYKYFILKASLIDNLNLTFLLKRIVNVNINRKVISIVIKNF